jgi:hypothetical protein
MAITGLPMRANINARTSADRTKFPQANCPRVAEIRPIQQTFIKSLSESKKPDPLRSQILRAVNRRKFGNAAEYKADWSHSTPDGIHRADSPERQQDLSLAIPDPDHGNLAGVNLLNNLYNKDSRWHQDQVVLSPDVGPKTLSCTRSLARLQSAE